MKVFVIAVKPGNISIAAFVAVTDGTGHHTTGIGIRQQAIDTLVLLTDKERIGEVADIVHHNAVTLDGKTEGVPLVQKGRVREVVDQTREKTAGGRS